MTEPILIDLHQMGRPHALGVYLLPGPEPALVDSGPASCGATLRASLAEHGLAVGDLADLLLTHVHVDHAGGAGELVAENPRLRVHVSPLGAPHLIEPSRLVRSSRRVFGDRFDALWGPITPVPAANVIAITGDTAAGLQTFPTPGHAIHHTAFIDDGGTCFCGDVCGVRIASSEYVAAGTPPPDVDLDAYAASHAEIRRRDPRRLALAHFGFADDVPDHLERMQGTLQRWSGWIRDGAGEAMFIARAGAELQDLDPAVVHALEVAADLRPSYAGLARYWSKRRDGDAS